MGGTFSAGGIISGLDSQSLIAQLIRLERQPVFRFEASIRAFEQKKEDLSDLRTSLLSVRDKVQDMILTSLFDQFKADISDDSVFTASISGSNPASNSYVVDVLQLATPTEAASGGRIGSAVNPAATLDSSGINTFVTAGTFSINGVAINVDPAAQSLDTILAAITGSAAGVTATYDALTDTVSIANTAPGDTSFINFGVTDDSSNFLAAIGVSGATQGLNGASSIEVTSTSPLGAVNGSLLLNAVNFAGGATTAGSFSINGIAITIDPTADTLNDVLARINSSDAGVTASFDPLSDTIRVVSDNLGSPTISFTSGTSNFLAVTSLTSAVQVAGTDAQFTINGGPVQTRNSNNVSDAIADITLNLLSLGSSTVTISSDEDAIIEGIRELIDEFNAALNKIAEITGDDASLENDFSIEGIEISLRSLVFGIVDGLDGDFNSLINIGISSGSSFDTASPFQLEFDEDAFRTALQDDPGNVADLFANSSDTGISDLLLSYLDGITDTSGFLNDRSKAGGSIDDQIKQFNRQIDAVERRIELKEARLRAQFASLEVMLSTLQSQSAGLLSLSAGFGRF